MYRNFDNRKIRISAEKPPNSRLHLVAPCLSPTFHVFDIDTAHKERLCVFIHFLFKQLEVSFCRRQMYIRTCSCFRIPVISRHPLLPASYRYFTSQRKAPQLASEKRCISLRSSSTKYKRELDGSVPK